MRSRSPGENDEDLKRPVRWAHLRRLFAFARPELRLLLSSGFLALISGSISLALPILVRQSVNDVQSSGNVNQLDQVALALLGLLLISGALGFAHFLVSALAGNRTVNAIREHLIQHLQRLPVAYFDRSRSGDLASLLNSDVGQLQTTLTDDLARLPANVILVIGLTGVAIWMNWRLTLVVVTVLALMMLFFVVTGRALRVMNRAALDQLAETMGGVTEVLANIRLVKAFARERYEDERTRSGLAEVLKRLMKGARWEATMSSVGSIGALVMVIGVMWYGARGVLAGQFRAGDVAGFIVVIMFLAGPMGLLATLYTRLQRASGAADRIFAILDEPMETPDVLGAVPYPDGPGEVTFEGIEFAYSPGTPVLRSLTLHVPAGTVCALVGPSGSGKTTIGALLFRFYEPQSGEIRIDGVPIRQIQRESLRAHLGIVPQEPILFNGTLRDNIRYGKLDATEDEIRLAARDANVEEFIEALPNGYETLLGERGVNLSGGQRQRVAIARALLKNPRILILDEATSALDARSEALVKEALDRLMQGRTTLVIAHRLSTIQNADQIAVVVAGRISEQGVHDALIRRGGTYAELYALVGA